MLGSILRLAAAGTRGRLLILTYHRVVERYDPLREDMDADSFADQLRVLRERFAPLPLAEGVARLRDGSLPPLAVAVTFDDGYRDNFTVAAPLLHAAGVPAAFFVATGFLDGGRMWNDTFIETVRQLPSGDIDLGDFGLGRHTVSDVDSRRRLLEQALPLLKQREGTQRLSAVNAVADRFQVSLPSDMMMTSAQVGELASRGMEIGSHTVNHSMLSQLGGADVLAELTESRGRLEAVTGKLVTGFAFPNGRPGIDYRATDVSAVKAAGYKYACSTGWGVAEPKSDCLQLPRISPWRQTGIRFAATLLRAFRATGVPAVTS